MTSLNNNVVANVPGNLDAGQQQIIVNAIQNAIASGGTFQLQPDGSAGSVQMAQSIMQQAGQSGNGVQVLPPQSSSSFLQNAVTGAQMLMNPGEAVNAATASGSSFLQAHAANWGLIFLGVVLGVGALLISQKETIIQIGKTTAKAAAVVGA